MVSKFPTTINTDVNIKALHHAMSSALERTIIDELELDAFFELLVL